MKMVTFEKRKILRLIGDLSGFFQSLYNFDSNFFKDDLNKLMPKISNLELKIISNY